MFDPGPCVYMEKLAVGPRAKGACDIRKTPTQNLECLSEALGRPVRDLTVVILDRPTAKRRKPVEHVPPLVLDD